MTGAAPKRFLVELLLSMFDDAELERLVRHRIDEGVSQALPRGTSIIGFTDAVVEQLYRRGLIDKHLFAVLESERPGRVDDIRAVAVRVLAPTVFAEMEARQPRPDTEARIMIVGSIPRELRDVQTFMAAADALGRSVAISGAVLVACSFNQKTIDGMALRGASNAMIAAKTGFPRAEVFLSKDSSESVDLRGLDTRIRRCNGREEAFDLAIHSVTAVIALGGARGTTYVVQEADRLDKPILLYAGFGGASARFLTKLTAETRPWLTASTADMLNEPWNDGMAERLISEAIALSR